MVNLILTLISIALVSALATVSINYLPWHVKPAAEISVSVRDSLGKIERAYQVVVAANEGVAPPPGGSAELAFQETFVDGLLRFNPAAPHGYSWSYFQYADSETPGSAYDGLHFVCLEPPSGLASDMALEHGLKRAVAIFSPEQVTLSTACGSTSSESSFTSAPVVTMFLVPAPEFLN